ncbi:MarR family winged helix-turn-helix transcriptional regulator [Lachnospira multipara]|uniref:MarR family winged helix-turn-helix transcriptional regulator n=1 Tax=Lachnospira multipara TaxID=28051 RepID=UPI00048337BD|nr:MarR family transcriptional regulator [Lachnospira multipara]
MNESAVSRLCKLDRVIKRRFDKLADSTGINGAEGRVIHYLILNQDKITFQKDVEIEFDLRPSSASELLKRMEKKGLIERMSVESDARLKKIVLTDKSREHEERITRDLLKFEADTQVGISDEDLDVFDRVTNIIMANLKNIND